MTGSQEKSAEQYFTQIAAEKEEDASDSFAIDYDQLETVMQAAEEQFYCTQKLNFEEVLQQQCQSIFVTSITEEWQCRRGIGNG